MDSHCPLDDTGENRTGIAASSVFMTGKSGRRIDSYYFGSASLHCEVLRRSKGSARLYPSEAHGPLFTNPPGAIALEKETKMTFYRFGRWSCAPAYADCNSGWRPAWRKRRRDAVDSNKMYSWNSGPMFGIRRPLRHLTWKLDLDEDQVREMADILARLKTARARARVEREGSVNDLAQAFAGEDFDDEKAAEAIERRKNGVGEQEDSVLEALRRIYEMLDADQRAEFAYQLRSGSVDL